MFFVKAFPSESRQRAMNTVTLAENLQGEIPRPRELPLTADVPKVSGGESKLVNQAVLTKLVDDFRGSDLCHTHIMTNNLSKGKTGKRPYAKIICHSTMSDMELDNKPFGDIAARLRWHRDLEGLTQTAYSKKIGVKRATLNNWESGDYRLSLDGALALRQTYGLSLDFMYEGIDDALPMTLRQAWQSKP